MNKLNPKVDGYLRKHKWQEPLEKLRRIILESELTEEVKWRVPCYTFQNSNVVILGSFKEFCSITFVKGALLNDTHGILSKPGENTQSARRIQFTDVAEIVKMAPILRAYIEQAIGVEKAGLKVTLKKITEHKVPQELQARLDETPSLKTAFHALTPGRQRAYLLYFSSAKQSRTRAARIEKCVPQILDGKGLDD